YAVTMEVFAVSKHFPPEEKYSLTDRIRRSSRSVCTNLREAWPKRRYEAHFVSKLTDADGEHRKTETWLDFAHDCGYLPTDLMRRLLRSVARSTQCLGTMISDPSSLVPKPTLTSKLLSSHSDL